MTFSIGAIFTQQPQTGLIGRFYRQVENRPKNLQPAFFLLHENVPKFFFTKLYSSNGCFNRVCALHNGLNSSKKWLMQGQLLPQTTTNFSRISRPL